MTKPTPPSQPEELVEMEAMDLEEWEKDQHTPQAPDAKLAALVKQSAEVTPPAAVRHQQSNSVARTMTKQPPPTPGGNQARFGAPGPAKPNAPNPFDGPTMVNAGAAVLPTRADLPTTTRSTTATPAAGTPTNRHTTTRSATPAATPRLQQSQTATPAGPTPRLQPTAASQTATPAAGSPSSASTTAASAGAAPAGSGATTAGEAPTPQRTHTQAIGRIERTPAAPAGSGEPAGGAPTPQRTHTQAIGRIERTPAAPEKQPPTATIPARGIASPSPSTKTPVGGVPAVRATPVGGVPTKTAQVAVVPTRSATPVGGVPAVSAKTAATPAGGAPVTATTRAATPVGGTPVVSAKMTQTIGAVERPPAAPSTASTTPSTTPTAPSRATPAAGAPIAKPASTPAGGVPAVSAKMTQAIGAIERSPAPIPEDSEGWSLPDDFDEVAAQEWKAPPVAAFAAESTASRALAMPTPAATPKLILPTPPAASPPSAAPPPAAWPSPSPDVAPEPSVVAGSDLFAAATATGGPAFAPESPPAPRTPRPAPTGPMPFVTQSSVQPHSQPVHVIHAPQPVAAQLPPVPRAPVPQPAMFEEARSARAETTDSYRIVSDGKKPWLLIGGVGLGAVALIVIVVMLMGSKDKPEVADTPKQPTPDRVDPVVKPPPDEAVAVVTPDAAEPHTPDVTAPPRTGRDPTAPDPGTPKDPGTTPKNPKNPRIRGTKTTPIETVNGTRDPVGADTGDKTAKAQAAYKTGNQKLFAGDASGAILAYRQVIAMGSSSGYRGLGLAYAQQGDTANAIAAFKKYLQMSPKAADAAVIKKRLAALQGK